MSLLPYHFLLAAKSLRRDGVMSLLMLVALSLGTGVWSLAVCQFTRFNGYEIRLPETLHQVEILRPRDSNSVFADGAASDPYMVPTDILSRTQISFPEYQRLAGSRSPARQSAGIRSEVVVRGPAGTAETRVARFTDAAFFSMFQRPFATGDPWTAAEDRGGAGVVVLGRATGRALFPPYGNGLGQTVHVEGRPFRVVGVLAEYQPLNAPWQLLLTGGFEDALFLPIGDFQPMGGRPEEPIFRSPPPRLPAGRPGTDGAAEGAREALLKSDALFVTLWVDLPTSVARANYVRDLDAMLGRGHYLLRSLPRWRRDMGMPASQIAFFSFMGVVILVGGGFTLSRWLLTKGLSRGAELGVYRALGAPRASLFWRVIAEAVLLAIPAALLSPLMALPGVWMFNRNVHVVDMPLELGPVAVLSSIIPAFVICVLGAVYPAWRLARTAPTIYLGRP